MELIHEKKESKKSGATVPLRHSKKYLEKLDGKANVVFIESHQMCIIIIHLVQQGSPPIL
jgi:hypothetical protein